MAKVVFKEDYGVGSCESMDDRSELHQYYDDIGSSEPRFLALKMICEAAVKLSDEEENTDNMEGKGSGEDITPTNVMSRDLKESAPAPQVSPSDQGHSKLLITVEQGLLPLKKRKIVSMSSNIDQQDQSDGGKDHEAMISDSMPSPCILARAARRRGRRRSAVGVFMQGPSRCSRYNGRGWRCSRLTTSGHALCEYHLEKARTRSNTNHFNGHGLGNKSNINHVDV